MSSESGNTTDTTGEPSRFGGLPQATVVALSLSLVPVVVVEMAEGTDPFIFNSLQLAAQVPAVSLAAALIAQRTGVSLSEARRTFGLVWTARKMSLVWVAVLLALTAANYGLFVWSTRLVEPTLSVMLYETWPITMALMLARKGGPAARRLSGSAAIPLCLAIVGVSFVIASQAEGALYDTTLKWAFGVGLALAAGVMGGVFPAATLMFGWVAAASGMDGARRNPQLQVVFWASLAHAVGAAMGSVVCFVIALLGNSETVAVSMESFVGATIMGGILVGVAGVSARIAHVKSHNLGIHAVYGIAPLLAILWLAALGFTLSHLWMFALGAALIVGTNAYVGRQSLRA